MAAVTLSSIKGKTLEDVINAIEKQRREMEFLLTTLDDDNIQEVSGDKVINLEIDQAQIRNLLVDTANIKDLAVTGAKIGEAQIGSAHIKELSVGNAHLQNASIDNLKIDRATANKLQIVAADIVNGSITNAKIDRATVDKLVVVTADIKDAAITNAKILDATIDGSAKIKLASITTGLIKDAAITQALIADLSVTDAKIVDLAANKLTAGTIDTGLVTISGTGGKLLLKNNRIQVFDNQQIPVERVAMGDVMGDGSVYGFLMRGADGTTVLMDINGVKTAGITDGAITNPKIGDGAVKNENIFAGTITGDRMIADAITSRELAVGAITAAKAIIADSTIGAAQIIDASITNAKIADATITNAKIKDLDASKIASGKINTERLEVSGLVNIVGNNKFENGSTEGWEYGIAGAYPKILGTVTPGAPSDYVGQFIGRDTEYGAWFDVNPGESFVASAWACNVDSPYQFGVGLHFQTTTGDQWIIGTAFSPDLKVWTFKQGTLRAPSNATKARVFIQVNGFENFGNWFGTLFDIRRQGVIRADMLEAGSVIAQDIIFKGKLEGASGTFTGAVNVLDSQYNRRAFVEKGYIRADNGDGMGRAAVMQDGLFSAYNDDVFGKVEVNGAAVIGVSYNPNGFQGIIGRIDFSEEYLELTARNKLKLHGFAYEPLTDGQFSRYLWAGVDYNEIGSTGLFRANSNINGIGGHEWKYLNSYGHDGMYALQEMTDFNAIRKGVRVKNYGTWQPWRLCYMGNYGTARTYQYASTRTSVTVNHGLGVVPTNIQLTLRWRDGAISIDNIKSVYISGDPTSTQFTISVAGVNFAAGQWIDVDWACAT